jgi:hypothetical protein
VLLLIIVNDQLLAADAFRMLSMDILVKGSIGPSQKVNKFLGKDGAASSKGNRAIIIRIFAINSIFNK